MAMKKIVIITLLFVTALPAIAQREGKRGERRHRDITEMVSDLSASQKRKIDAIGKESKERVGAMRQQQKQVRDSIAMYMDRDGDQSRALYPLFEREANIQVSINREMYTTKRRIDEVLTASQRDELRQAMKKRKK